ncbi:sugar-binding transcriptional regulator [Allorhizobium borbori]|uniref:Dihydroxyacetone kinase-like protein n=1 Tax=Allorhizobium borbori TaxID=485907 RepID=A0A7W6K7H6_9HYPH|nr:sugar-binding domain-containing protein [Allorhizobium borbori]MBB4105530.1 dihydroxyacetone kinase-like protein [Allorhizobium borbori]
MKKTDASTPKASGGRKETPAQFGMDEVLWAAWLYYERGLKQDEVADQLGVSRASIFNLLQKARDEGVVRIAIDPTRMSRIDLALELAEMTGISEFYILPATRQGGSLFDQLGTLGARVLEQKLTENDTIGVAWGRTIMALSKALLRASLPHVTVAQVTGSSAATFDFSPVLCTSNIAERLNARAVNLHAPGVVSSSTVKQILLNEPAIRDHFSLLRQCTKSIFGVTQLEGETLLVQGGFMTMEEVAVYRKAGAVGFASGFFFDRQGNIIRSEFDDRHITMAFDDLHKVPARICVGGGMEKVEAICAMLKTKMANVIVIDEQTATAVYQKLKE